MRIGLITDEFLPDSTKAHAKMFYELALKLKSYGHTSIVIPPGKPSQPQNIEIDFLNGIEVWRSKSGYRKGENMVKRAINEFLLSFRAWIAIRKKVKIKKLDLCIIYSPTIFFGILAWKLKLQKTFIYLVLRDMFPQWMIDQGLIKKNSLIAYFFRFFEKVNYKAANVIGLQSKANLDLFKKKFPNFTNVEVLMNWTITDYIRKDKKGISFRNKFNLNDKILFLYGGNIGPGQDLKNILRLAKNLKNVIKAHFLIIGKGYEFEQIKCLISKWHLNNVTILPSVPQKEFESILAISDVGLFSLSKEHSSHNFPGKILGYLRAGKPVLGSVNPDNDLKHIINNQISKSCSKRKFQ